MGDSLLTQMVFAVMLFVFGILALAGFAVLLLRGSALQSARRRYHDSYQGKRDPDDRSREPGPRFVLAFGIILFIGGAALTAYFYQLLAAELTLQPVAATQPGLPPALGIALLVLGLAFVTLRHQVAGILDTTRRSLYIGLNKSGVRALQPQYLVLAGSLLALSGVALLASNFLGIPTA